MEPRDPQKVAEGKPQVDNIVQSGIESESMIAAQIVRTKEQLVTEEIPTFLADYLDETLQCLYEKAHMGV